MHPKRARGPAPNSNTGSPVNVGSTSARELLHSFLSSDDEESAAQYVLNELESDHSMLTGMYRSFLKEAGIQPSNRVQLHTMQQQHQHHQQHQQHKRLRDTELMLHVTLEELFSGAVKLVPVQRKRSDGLGHVVQVQENLQVRVQPGLKEGTRITLPGLGNEDVCGNMSDLTFIVQQQLHPAYRRLADDLYAIVNVPLVTALTGGPVNLKTLSGQLLQLPVGDIITPGSELVLPNQGMPVFGDSTGRRGALHVKFNVNFPAQLSEQQQVMLRQALAGCEFPVLPKPTAGPRVMLPAAAPSGAAKQQQEGQQQKGQWHRLGITWQHAAVSMSAGASSSSTAAAAGFCYAAAAGSTGSSSEAGFACTHSTGSSKIS